MQKLNTHFCDPRQPQNIHCEKFPYVSKSLEDVINHMKEDHKEKKEKCEFCVFQAESRDEMTDHIYDKHEDMGVLNALAQQQRYVAESFDLFKKELTTVLNGIIDGHNAIKQELFIIRKNQVSEKKIVDIEKSVLNLSSLIGQDINSKNITHSSPKIPKVL